MACIPGNSEYFLEVIPWEASVVLLRLSLAPSSHKQMAPSQVKLISPEEAPGDADLTLYNKGSLIVQPDRGYNVYVRNTCTPRLCLTNFIREGTIDYQGRQHQIDFVLNPYYSTSDLGFTDAQQTLQLNYQDTLLYTERAGAKTSGLDAAGVRAAESGYPSNPLADPQMPIPSSSINRLTLDLEGLVLNADGT